MTVYLKMRSILKRYSDYHIAKDWKGIPYLIGSLIISFWLYIANPLIGSPHFASRYSQVGIRYLLLMQEKLLIPFYLKFLRAKVT